MAWGYVGESEERACPVGVVRCGLPFEGESREQERAWTGTLLSWPCHLTPPPRQFLRWNNEVTTVS